MESAARSSDAEVSGISCPLVALLLIAINCFSPLFGYHTGHGVVLLFGVTIVAATR